MKKEIYVVNFLNGSIFDSNATKKSYKIEAYSFNEAENKAKRKARKDGVYMRKGWHWDSTYNISVCPELE